MSCLIIEDNARFREVKAKIEAAKAAESAATSTTTESVDMASDGFTPVGNSKVLYINSKITYFEAKEKCRSLGSNLVEMRSEEERNEVNCYYTDYNVEIALTDFFIY